ncbi:Sec62/63 complex, subunit Sec66 [Scheffersomyces amazonensis]|uniref:Sec62/63 complex, subunit Sec66 n=1 Tax=Scheffersomyces amazonensis TaxID=1078765 RepID=UPI00315D6181
MSNSTNSTESAFEDSIPPIRISVWTPLIYTAILLSLFITFSVVYRRNRINKLSKIESIFGENHPKKLYEFLKDPENKPHEKVLKAALLRRCVEAVRRTMKLKEHQPIYVKLYQDGLIGDDIYKQFEIELKLQELEFKEIVMECETYKKGWSTTFIPLTQEICFNEALRRRVYSMDDRSESLSELWDYFGDKVEPPTEVIDDTKSAKKKKEKVKASK